MEIIILPDADAVAHTAADIRREFTDKVEGTIREGRHLLLIGLGQAKARAVAAAAEGPVTAACPASALQLHPHATVLVDMHAASQLKHTD
jgi:glucosamine-6-phosphate deaminase